MTEHAARHRWVLPAHDIERHVDRRGRVHAFERIDPRSSALVVVDPVPFFVDDHPVARGAIHDIDQLAAAMRAAGGTVAWVVPATAEPSAREREFYGRETAERYATSGGAGPIRNRIAPALTTDEDDLYVEKSSPGAFFPGRCDLHGLLQSRSVDTVVIAGAVAGVCCESSVREAATLGYRVVLAADAVLAVDDTSLDATVRTVYRSFGDVRSTVDLLPLLGPASHAVPGSSRHATPSELPRPSDGVAS